MPISAWHHDHVTFNELLGRLRARRDRHLPARLRRRGTTARGAKA
jgi:hypothetical protein